MNYLNYYKTDVNVQPPEFGTKGSACFDIKAYLTDDVPIVGYDNFKKVEFYATNGKLPIMPGYRYLIPTGLIFDIPKGYSLRLHMRSGLALKRGLILTNSEGIIDEDYVDPTFVMVHTHARSRTPSGNFEICSGDRIAQGELVAKVSTLMMEIKTAPKQKTDRAGGFGSTGK